MVRFPLRACLVLSALLVLTASPLFAQASRPQSDDKEKKKLAEIAQRPEVIKEIEDSWGNLRRQDMEFAFRVNSASHRGDWRANPEWADYLAKYGQLYDNPILANYVNALGQRLVPKDSPNLYVFRLLFDPTPQAEALTTGTIYISTGLVSMLDNEAQLAYILSHEIAHVERNHAYNALRNDVLDDKLAVELQKSSQKKRAIFGMVAAAAGGVAGGLANGAAGAQIGALAGFAGGAIAGAIIVRNKFEPTAWDAVFENEADEVGLGLMVDQRFDGREVPRLYARLNNLVTKDKRAGLGFISNSVRIQERSAHVQGLLTGSMKTKIDDATKAGGLVGSTSEFSVLMAALKRDNGVLALEHDLLPMARENLEEAVNLRSNDPRAQYYLGKIYATTGRTPEDKQKAISHLQSAIRYDGQRGSYADPHLEYALHLISQNNPATNNEVRDSLKKYVSLYQREHTGSLPPNMYIIYDYLLMAGEDTWYVPPTVVTTSTGQPLGGSAPVTAAAPAAAPAPPTRRP